MVACRPNTRGNTHRQGRGVLRHVNVISFGPLQSVASSFDFLPPYPEIPVEPIQGDIEEEDSYDDGGSPGDVVAMRLFFHVEQDRVDVGGEDKAMRGIGARELNVFPILVGPRQTPDGRDGTPAAHQELLALNARSRRQFRDLVEGVG